MLLTDVLREKWGYKGFVVTDWGAVKDRVKGVQAGLDLEMPLGSLVTCGVMTFRQLDDLIAMLNQ